MSGWNDESSAGAEFPLQSVVNLRDMGAMAEKFLEPQDADYYNGGAEDERTLAANSAAFESVTLWPRVLVDVTTVDTRCHLPTLGLNCSSPIMAAPVAMQKLAHMDGEIAAAKAAGAAGMAYCVAQQATTSIEDIAASKPPGPLLFQMYVLRDRELMVKLVRRAEAAGCSALVVTVDSPVLGRRERDVRNKFKLKTGLSLANFAGVKRNPSSSAGSAQGTQAGIAKRIGNRDAGLTWNDLDWLKKMTRLPVVLKGVLRYDDAQLAVLHGVDGVWVSNHGGRQLDGAASTLLALPEVVAGIGGRIPVLFDGGVRRGTDALKALALGASAVFVGRPVVWGLALGGQAGVEHMLGILQEELKTAMMLSGCPSLKGITRDLVTVAGESPPRTLARPSRL